MATAPQIIQEIIEGLRYALKDKDHYSRKSKTLLFSANDLLLTLRQMAASHESYADKMVESGVAPLIFSYIQCNPHTHYWSVRRAAECLWTLVQVGQDKYVPTLRYLISNQSSMVLILSKFLTRIARLDTQNCFYVKDLIKVVLSIRFDLSRLME